MSFDLVPANVIFKIFHQLPLKDRVRLSGVNRLFKDASIESIAKMKSLIVDRDLEAYSVWAQKFSSLLESCSPTVESMDVINRSSCGKSFLNALTEFVFPKLEQLKITVVNDDDLTMKLISRNRNLRSVYLRLSCDFEWPQDVVFEKLETLEIRSSDEFPKDSYVKLSLTLHSLIGKFPNLKRFTIDGTDPYSIFFVSSSKEFDELLASLPYLEVLMCSPFAFIALPQLKYLKELRLPESKVTKDMLTKLIKAFPSITVLQIQSVDIQAIEGLSELKHLRELDLHLNNMATSTLIDLIINVPSLAILKICSISDNDSLQTLTDFLTSTGAIFQRNLEIRLLCLGVVDDDMELEQMKAILEEIKNNGGPVTEIVGNNIGWSIRYSL